MRDFGIDDVLTVTTGRLVSRRHMEGAYDILGYMTGERLFTHQLPRAADQVRPEILRQHPELANVEVPEEFNGEDEIWSWLSRQETVYGKTLPLAPLEGHVGQDPIEELCDKVGADKVFVVRVPDEEADADPS